MECQTCQKIVNLQRLMRDEAVSIMTAEKKKEWAAIEIRRQQNEALTLLEAVLDASGMYRLSNRSGRSCQDEFLPKLVLHRDPKHSVLTCWLPHPADHARGKAEMEIRYWIPDGYGCPADVVPGMVYKVKIGNISVLCGYTIEDVDLAAEKILKHLIKHYTSKECLARMVGGLC